MKESVQSVVSGTKLHSTERSPPSKSSAWQNIQKVARCAKVLGKHQSESDQKRSKKEESKVSDIDKLEQAAQNLAHRFQEAIRPKTDEQRVDRAIRTIRRIVSDRGGSTYISLITDELRLGRGHWHCKVDGEWRSILRMEEVLQQYPGKDRDWLLQLLIKAVNRLAPKKT
jgi:hypothetical protein